VAAHPGMVNPSVRNAMLTLWDLIKPLTTRAKRPAPPRPVAPPAPPPIVQRGPSQAGRRVSATKPAPAKTVSAQEMYDSVVRDMLHTYGIRVRKWRRSMSGMAWEVVYRDGTRTRLIESPRPKGPMSIAIFLHEVGHHAIGLGAVSPRCLEELRAWQFSLAEMERLGLNITDSVRRRVDRSMRYAVAKAQRRGIRQLPDELVAYSTRR
jgi:hypothetical protein